MPKEKVVLKDLMFNKQKVEYIANNIYGVYPQFKTDAFVIACVEQFPKQELKERMLHITHMLSDFLTGDYSKDLEILIRSLPEPLDDTKTDDDFGTFILSSYGEFIALYGCTQDNYKISLNAFREFTMRFSMEFAIRPFLKSYREETLIYINTWTQDTNYHVRRLASEGTRPNLPWGGKVDIGLENNIKILDQLYTDTTRYVTRSVANHMNDISKLDPNLVIDTLKKWKSSQLSSDIDYIISHSLRSLIKQGNSCALELLGFGNGKKINIENFQLKHTQVILGESLEFSFDIIGEIGDKLMIDYNIYFVDARGKNRAKTFKVTKKSIPKEGKITLIKKHPLKEMTTKKLYSGEHFIQLQINGILYEKHSFDLSIT